MKLKQLITTAPDILSGQPVFGGTRVPAESLFDHLGAGVALNEFLDDFPTVSREQAIGLPDKASTLLTAKNVAQLHEAVA